MGWWELKDNLNAQECLQLCENPLADSGNFFVVTDFINYETKSGELSDVDKEHIYKLIKDGFTSGEINDWD